MFWTYRFLVTTTAAVLLAALVLVAWLYNRQAVNDLVDMTARHSVAMDRILLNTIWSRHGDYLSNAGSLDAQSLRNRSETADIRATFKTATEGVDILKVKLYRTDGLILFSTDTDEIGNDYSHSSALQAAVHEGRISSKLSYEDRISAFSGEVFDRDVVETYLPKLDTAGNVVGVIELYADVTEDKKQIDAASIRLLVGLTAIFATAYAVLAVGVMRRAIEPIRLASRRAAEIGPQATGVRLPTEGMPREILPLITAINDALDRLDVALDAQRRFAADAAHELLTPLAILRAQADTIDSAAIAEPLRRDVDAMADMVNQLLDLAELEAQGKAAGAQERTDLHCVVVDVVSMLAPLAIRNGKEIALTGSSGPLPVRGHPKMLSRALRNLVENALRHTPVRTTVLVDLASDGTVRVSDQGEGVPPEMRTAVFQRFWRGDKRASGGAGLGLSIVKRIVEGVGGRVWVEGAAGGGACFAMQFTLADALDANASRPAGPQAPG